MNPSCEAEESHTNLISSMSTSFFDWAPNTHRKLAVFACIVNVQLGVPALVLSLLAQADFDEGNAKSAVRKAKLARKLSIAGICMTIFFILHFLLLHLFVFPYTLYPKIFLSYQQT